MIALSFCVQIHRLIILLHTSWRNCRTTETSGISIGSCFIQVYILDGPRPSCVCNALSPADREEGQTQTPRTAYALPLQRKRPALCIGPRADGRTLISPAT